MDINNETINHLADLAKLEFTEIEKEDLKTNLGRILSYCEKLNEVDTTGVEPLIFMSENVNLLRTDEAELNYSKSDALRNAPAKDSDYFRVPKFR
jgi:aspartyl-tRNA(Asn)/glutamyl-tRNA(Gln) amidotransferase subunit C